MIIIILLNSSCQNLSNVFFIISMLHIFRCHDFLLFFIFVGLYFVDLDNLLFIFFFLRNICIFKQFTIYIYMHMVCVILYCLFLISFLYSLTFIFLLKKFISFIIFIFMESIIYIFLYYLINILFKNEFDFLILINSILIYFMIIIYI